MFALLLLRKHVVLYFVLKLYMEKDKLNPKFKV